MRVTMNIDKFITRSILICIFTFFALETILPGSWVSWIKDHAIYIIALYIIFMDGFGESLIYHIAALFGKDLDGSANYKGKHSKEK